MQVKRLELDDREARARWDAYAAAHGQLCHHSGWADLLQRVYGFEPVYLYLEDGGRIVSLLPLFRVRKPLGGSELVSVPHVESGGFADTSHHALFFQYLHENFGAKAIKICQSGEPIGAYEANLNEVVMVKPLPDNVEGIIPAMKLGMRTTMRRSLRLPYRAVICRDEAAFRTLYRLYLDKMHDFGTPPHRYGFFNALRETFGEACVIILLKDDKDSCVGATMVIGFQDTLYSMYFLVPAPLLKQKAGHFLEYQVMEYGVTHGFKSLVLGRCESNGSNYQYKASLGGEPRAVYNYKFLAGAHGFHCVGQKTAKQKYQKLAQIWSKLPSFCTDNLGPVLRKWIY